MPVPVYIFHGFLESGKTTLIKSTLEDEGFNEGEKTLLIVCEEGIEEYESHFLEETNTEIEYIEDNTTLSSDYFIQCEKQYRPDRVMIEYNGTWKIDDLVDIELPLDWIFVQILSTIDATTFNNYVTNMRSFMFDIINPADVIIFNRCNESTKKTFLRGNVKAINKAAQIIYEGEDGSINELQDEEMPFDINADVIEISEDDYGLFYMDIIEDPEKYRGKTVQFKGRIMLSNQSNEVYVIGRNAMVCCAEDVRLIGLFVHSKNAEQMVDGDWIILKAKVGVMLDDDYQNKVPLLSELEYKRCRPMEDELVYFS